MDSGMGTRTIFRGKDIHVHEKYPRNGFIYSQIREQDIGEFFRIRSIESRGRIIVERGWGVGSIQLLAASCSRLLLRTCTHTVTRTRRTQRLYKSGLLSGGRTRVAAYVGGVFAKLWCPRAFMGCLARAPIPSVLHFVPRVKRAHTSSHACYFASAPQRTYSIGVGSSK